MQAPKPRLKIAPRKGAPVLVPVLLSWTKAMKHGLIPKCHGLHTTLVHVYVYRDVREVQQTRDHMSGKRTSKCLAFAFNQLFAGQVTDTGDIFCGEIYLPVLGADSPFIVGHEFNHLGFALRELVHGRVAPEDMEEFHVSWVEFMTEEFCRKWNGNKVKEVIHMAKKKGSKKKMTGSKKC